MKEHRRRTWSLVIVTLIVAAVILGAAPPLAAHAVQAQPLPAQAPTTTTYVVQPGDTLTRIAARYGITVSQLAAANGLGRNAWVYAGQSLTIPGTPLDPVPAPSGSEHVVQAGETLMSIAVRYGVSVSELSALNGMHWNAWVYRGQYLTIPGDQVSTSVESAPEEASVEAATSEATALAEDGVYVVKAGNTLFSIARWHGTNVGTLRAVNGLTSNTIYVGQRLTIPGSDTVLDAVPTAQPAPPPPTGAGANGEKWIDVNLTQQRVTAYEGQTPVYSALASTGTWATPTVVGTFQVYVKYVSTRMSGPGYDLPNVPHTMYFYKGYGIHGAYWHNNFGTPMSHGCVNLSLPDAEWFYTWAPVGTKVVTHY
jgi:LysM repeat protein